MRHIGNDVWWIGLSGGNDGRTYSNIFRGTITTLPVYDNIIEGEWVDVPRGTNMNAGTMSLDISGSTNDKWINLFKISQTGGFGPDTWAKLR